MKKQLSAGQVTPGLLPFLEDALSKNICQYDEDYEVDQVTESRKRTGYLIKCVSFQIFLWKSDPICDILIETLDELTRLNPSHALFVTPSDSTVEGFSLFTDDEITRMWTRTKKQRVLDVWQSQTMSSIHSSGKGNSRRKV